MRKNFTVCYCTGIKITFFAVLWTNNLFVVKLQRKARAELMAPEHPSQHFNNQWLDKGQESPVFILCHITAACSVSPAQTLRGLNQVYEKACESLHCRKFGPVGLGAKNTEAVCVYTQSCIVVAPPQKKVISSITAQQFFFLLFLQTWAMLLMYFQREVQAVHAYNFTRTLVSALKLT